MQKIVCGIIRTDKLNHILISHRKPEADYGGLWEFPGGKVEPGESLEDALTREIHEELGIGIAVGEPYHQRLFNTTNLGIVELDYFLCDWVSGVVVATGCADFRIEHVANLPRYQMMPVDTQLARIMALEFMLQDVVAEANVRAMQIKYLTEGAKWPAASTK